MHKLLLAPVFAIAIAPVFAQTEEPFDSAKTGYIGFHLTPGLSATDQLVFIVDMVLPGSPAAKAQMHRGDAIRSVNGLDVIATDDFLQIVHEAKPGQVLTFVVNRLYAKSARAIAVTVEPLTDGVTAKLRKMKPGDLKSLGIPTIAYIPQRLCYTGVSFSEALALTVAPGAVNIPLSELEQCRQIVEPCQPVGLLQQTKSSTTVKRGIRKYRLAGDWKGLTFLSEAECRQSHGGQSQTAEAPHP
jgi:membrane-associated protease RseP (regulator of RpoE activity)